LHDRILQDPLYQLIKHHIRDVQQRDIEGVRKNAALRKVEALRIYINGDPSEDENLSDQCIAEKIMAENLRKWKPLLDKALDPDKEKIRKDQIDLAVLALVNTARVTALPVIIYLVDKARYDINRPLPSLDPLHGQGTQQIGDFFRSNYAAYLALLKKGARMPVSATAKGKKRDLLVAIAKDGQSTHMSQVNLVLKKYVQIAEALMERAADGPSVAECMTTELAKFCYEIRTDGSTLPSESVRVTEAYLVNAVDKRLSDAALFRIGVDVPHVRLKLGLHRFSIDQISTAKPSSSAETRASATGAGGEDEQLQSALGQIRVSLSRSINRFFSSLTERPVYGGLVETGAKAVDLVYKALVCMFAGHESADIDIVDDVLVPLFQALLKAQNEYGWANNSCAPGSISFVVAVLEGRLDLEESSNPLVRLDASRQPAFLRLPRTLDAFARLTQYREGLEEAFLAPTPENLEAIRAEALRRCAGRPDFSRKKLAAILEVIAGEPEAFAYALNELRGFFFSQLAAEYDTLLAQRFYGAMDRQRRARSHRPADTRGYREPEYISPGMGSLLDDLSRLADVFARSFLLVVEDIPRVFGMVLKS
jgi:hypothetical protein